MTLNKPEPGELFGHTNWDGPLRYVGTMTSGTWVLETATESAITFTSEAAASELFPHLEPVAPLEAGQLFRRTRYDYSGQTAEILAVFKGIAMHNSDGDVDHPLWVAYRTHPNNNGREPKIKDEISFRRIFGKRADSV